MYAEYDLIIYFLLSMATFFQLAPVYLVLRITKITGWVRYWSTSWTIFCIAMIWIMIRRSIVFITYDINCELSPSWIFDQIISPIGSSVLFIIYTHWAYKFYKHWLEIDALKSSLKNK